MISLPLAMLREVAAHRPPEYLPELCDAGIIAGDDLLLDEDVHAALAAKYRPTLAEMLKNVSRAAANWAAAGFPVTEQRTYMHRAATCATCPHHSADAWVHACAICGCSGIKLHLASERCPAGKW